MRTVGIDVAIVTDDDSVYYFTGYYDYLHMEFGRPTLLVVWRDGATLLITPNIDYNSALDHAQVAEPGPAAGGLGPRQRQHASVGDGQGGHGGMVQGGPAG